MKTTLLFTVLLVVAPFGGIGLAAQATRDAELKRLEAQLESLAGTDLPEFAPEAFDAVRAKARAMRSAFKNERRVSRPALRRAHQELAAFEKLVFRTRESMGKAYGLRNTSIRFNPIRAFDAAKLYDAEKTYREALRLAGQQRFDEARRRADRARGDGR